MRRELSEPDIAIGSSWRVPRQSPADGQTMQNTQICTRLDGIRNRKSAAHNGGSRAPRPGPSATARDVSRITRPYVGWGTTTRRGGGTGIGRQASNSVGPGNTAGPAPRPAGRACLTRAGVRPLLCSHGIPEPGIPQQLSSSSPDSGKSHRFPGSSPPLGHKWSSHDLRISYGRKISPGHRRRHRRSRYVGTGAGSSTKHSASSPASSSAFR